MPYIRQEERLRAAKLPETPGELNYAITTLCVEYLHAVLSPGYQDMNEIMGVLECAKQEFYRQVVAPYEDRKLKENGDVC